MKLWILAGFVYVPSQQAQDCPVEISHMLVFVLADMDCFLSFLFSQVMSEGLFGNEHHFTQHIKCKKQTIHASNVLFRIWWRRRRPTCQRGRWGWAACAHSCRPGQLRRASACASLSPVSFPLTWNKYRHMFCWSKIAEPASQIIANAVQCRGREVGRYFSSGLLHLQVPVRTGSLPMWRWSKQVDPLPTCVGFGRFWRNLCQSIHWAEE